MSLEQIGILMVEEGQAERGARLLGARETLRRSVYVVDFYPFMVRERERVISTAREQLGNAAYDEAYNKGRAMTLDEAVAYALRKAQ